mgnify:CR=1 FL=1
MLHEETPGQWVKIGKMADLEKKPFLKMKLLGKVVAVFSHKEHGLYGLEMTCKHQGADMTMGTIKNDVVTCPRHGWQYSIRTGKCLNRESLPLRRYAVENRDGDLYVALLSTPPVPEAFD